MKYKIVVDKQNRTNPTSEKREYEVDIEELRAKGNIYDSLMFKIDATYVIRRLKISEYQGITILDEPIKEPLENVNIELFEGDNYIYLIDMEGNRFYAEYLIRNEFNEVFATRKEMNSAINLTIQEIDLSVNQKFTNYSTTEEMNSAINIKANEIQSTVSETYSTKNETSQAKQDAIDSSNLSTDEKLKDYSTTTQMNSAITQKANEINLEVSKKVGNDEIISKINQTAEDVTIDANRININGTVSANGGFKILKDGSMEAVNGKFTGGSIRLEGGTEENPNFIIEEQDITGENYKTSNITPYGFTTYSSSDTYHNSASIQANENGSFYSQQTKNYWIAGTCYNDLCSFSLHELPTADEKNDINLLVKDNNASISVGSKNIKTVIGTTSDRSYLNITDYNASQTNQILAIMTEDATQLTLKKDGNTTIIQPNGIWTPTVTQTSLENQKKNFEKLQSGLDIIKNIDIYKYNLKSEDDNTKKHIGFVIGDKYKYSQEVTSNNNDGVDIYSFVAVCCKAIQEQQEQIEELQEKDKQKDEIIQDLIKRIEKLEAK